MTRAPKLEPCPHCGGKAKFAKAFTAHYVRCAQGCTDLHRDQKQAADFWNRRTPLPPLFTEARA